MGVFKAITGAAKAVKAAKDFSSAGGVDRAVEGLGAAAMGAVPGASTFDRLSGGALSGAVDRLGDRAQEAVDSRGGVRGLAQRGVQRGMDMARGSKDTRRSLSPQFQHQLPPQNLPF